MQQGLKSNNTQLSDRKTIKLLCKLDIVKWTGLTYKKLYQLTPLRHIIATLITARKMNDHFQSWF